jgi:hypothetical protein
LEPLHVKGKKLTVDVYAVMPLRLRQAQLRLQQTGLAAIPDGSGLQAQSLQLPELSRFMSSHYSSLVTTSSSITVKPMIGKAAKPRKSALCCASLLNSSCLHAVIGQMHHKLVVKNWHPCSYCS